MGQAPCTEDCEEDPGQTPARASCPDLCTRTASLGCGQSLVECTAACNVRWEPVGRGCYVELDAMLDCMIGVPISYWQCQGSAVTFSNMRTCDGPYRTLDVCLAEASR